MLLTDQSRLIELRLAVLRSANDRRDISAASGMFVRQCARVNEQRQDGDEKDKKRKKQKEKCRAALRVIFIKLLLSHYCSRLFFFLTIFAKIESTTTRWHCTPEISYFTDATLFNGSGSASDTENQRRKMFSRTKRIFKSALQKIINLCYHDMMFLVDVYNGCFTVIKFFEILL